MKRNILLMVTAPALLAACTPTLKLEAPDKPIEINLNVKVEQEVRVRVERDLEDDIARNPELFGLPATTQKKGVKK
jgi:hypothetical protein